VNACLAASSWPARFAVRRRFWCIFSLASGAEKTISPGIGTDSKRDTTLGNIHPQADGTLLVSASIYVASLAAGGQTFILEEKAEGWTVTGATGVTWIS
jgi:hypothetical protein